MKRYSKPTTTIEGFLAPKAKVEDIPISDISVARLIEDGLLVLYREIKNLMSRSTNGKLDASDARDLRDHLKLLFELKDREDALLRGLTDAELEARVLATKDLPGDKTE